MNSFTHSEPNGETEENVIDVYEPNNSYDNATDLGVLNDFATGYYYGSLNIHNHEDIDFYTLEVTSTIPDNTYVDLILGEENIDLDLYLYGNDIFYSSEEGIGYDEYFPIGGLEPGIYTIEVMGYESYGSYELLIATDNPNAKHYYSELIIPEDWLTDGLSFGDIYSELVYTKDYPNYTFSASDFALDRVLFIADTAKIVEGLQTGISVEDDGRISIDTSAPIYQDLDNDEIGEVYASFTVSDPNGLTDTGFVHFSVMGTDDGAKTGPRAKSFDSGLTVDVDSIQTGLNFGVIYSELVHAADYPDYEFTSNDFSIDNIIYINGSEWEDLSDLEAGISVDASGNITIDTTVDTYQNIDEYEIADVFVNFSVTDPSGQQDQGYVKLSVEPVILDRDKNEYNNSPENATELGTLINFADGYIYDNLNLHNNNDSDYYSFEVISTIPDNTYIDLILGEKDIDLDLYLYDSNNYQIDGSDDGVGFNEYFSIAGIEPGIYTIEVVGYESFGNYELSISTDNPSAKAFYSALEIQEDAFTEGLNFGEIYSELVHVKDYPNYTFTASNFALDRVLFVGNSVEIVESSQAGIFVGDDGEISIDTSSYIYQDLDNEEIAGVYASFTVSDPNGLTDTGFVHFNVIGLDDETQVGPRAKSFDSGLTVDVDSIQTGLNFGEIYSELVHAADYPDYEFISDDFVIENVIYMNGSEWKDLSDLEAGISVDASGNITIDTTVDVYQNIQEYEIAEIFVNFSVTDPTGLSEQGHVKFSVQDIIYQPDLYESNDAFENAYNFGTLDDFMNGYFFDDMTLHEEDYIDYYTFDITSEIPDYTYIDLYTIDQTNDFDLYLFDDNGNAIDYSELDAGRNDYLTISSLTPGQYTISVEESSGTGEYQLEIKSDPDSYLERVVEAITIDQHWIDISRSILGDGPDETINYFINLQADESFQLDHLNNTYTNEFSPQYISHINNTVESIDSIIDLDFERVYDSTDSIINFYLVHDVNLSDSYVTGYAQAHEDWWDIVVKDDLEEDYQYGNITHEFGHTLGLAHPKDDGFNPGFTVDDTTMSYNEGENGWQSAFTEADIQALIQIWGEENDLHTESIELSINSQTHQVASNIAIPIHISNAAEVESLDLILSYDPAVFSAPTSGDLITPGSLNPGTAFVVNDNPPGQISISWAGTSPLPAGAGSIATLNLQVRSDATPGDVSLIDLLSASINEDGISSELQDGSISILPPTFQVMAVNERPNGLALRLSEAPDMDAFNLYDGHNPSLDPADLLFSDAAGDPIALSAHWDNATNELLLLSSDPLVAGDYSFTIDSRSDGLISASSGELLDGNADGTPGDSFSFSYSHTTAEHALVIADTARGAGQQLSLNGRDNFDPTTGDVLEAFEGLPVHLSTVSSLISFTGTVSYDQQLLLDGELIAGSDLPADWNITIDPASPDGELLYAASGSTPISGDDLEILRFQATVSTIAAAPAQGTTGNGLYGSTTLIQSSFSSPQLPADPITGMPLEIDSDPGLVALAYAGDTTGNGTLSSLDAQRIQRVVVDLDSGFEAYNHLHPALIGDTTGNGALSSLDAARIQQQVVGLPVNSFPDVVTL